MRYYLICFSLLILTSCANNEQTPKLTTQITAPLGKSLNSDAFNRSFEELLANYYSLKDNFITENDTAISHYAKKLMVAADSLKLDELKADSALISEAATYAMGISSEIKGLLGETSIVEKRKEFQLVGDHLYDLIKTVKYDRELVFHDFCPMAFNDQGAYWLNNSSEIRNPYIPKTMITCGEIKDSIDLRPKQ